MVAFNKDFQLVLQFIKTQISSLHNIAKHGQTLFLKHFENVYKMIDIEIEYFLQAQCPCGARTLEFSHSRSLGLFFVAYRGGVIQAEEVCRVRLWLWK